MRYLLLVAVSVVSLAGCNGSDSEDSDSRSGPPSSETRRERADFVRRVDALCKQNNPELARIMTRVTRARDAARAGRASLPRTFRTFATELRKASAISERFRDQLRAVEVPRRERRFHDALYRSVEQGAANLRQQMRAAEAQDAVRLRELSIRGTVLNERAKGLVQGRGGFRFCGRG